MKKPRAGSALARFISTLRPDRRTGNAGSLPVQTGFPTSLADLYMKNQSRLKKPSSKTRRKRHVSFCTDSPDLATSLGLDDERDREVILRDDVVCEKKGYLGIGFFIYVNIFILLLLTIFGKNLVVGVTAFAFLMWFWDSIRPDLVRFLKPCPEARRNLNLEVVSPIREIEIEGQSDSIRSEIGDDSTRSRVSDEILIESFDLCDATTTLTRSNSKKKNILKKLFKNRSKKISEEQKSESFDSLGRCVEIKSISDSNFGKLEDEKANLIVEGNQVEDLKVEITQNCEIKQGFSWLLVFIIVIMFGLLGGKGIAIILTIFSLFVYILFK